MTPVADAYLVTLHDEEIANGVAQLIWSLLNRNLDYYRSRISLACKMSRPIAIVNTATGNACTIVFGREGAVIYNDVVGRPAITVTATVDQILNLSQVRMSGRGLFPVGLSSTPGKRLLRDIRTQKVSLKGVLAHPLIGLRTIALLSAIES